MLRRRSLILGCAASMLTRTALPQPAARSTEPPGAVTPHQFGAVGDGRTDDTDAVQRAVATGAPVSLPGQYRVRRGLALRPRQSLYGLSSRSSGLFVDHEYDMSSGPVIRLSGEPGGDIRDLSVSFTQPDTDQLSSLIRYPAAIEAINSPRFKITRVRIERALTALDMRGNSGGANIDDFEISAFERGIWIDGSLDSVKLSKIHIWPFGLSPKQRPIFSKAIGIDCCRCDDFNLSDSLIFGMSRSAVFSKGKTGATFGAISGVDFDDRGGLTIEQGNLRVTGCVFTLGASGDRWLTARVGALNVTGCSFKCLDFEGDSLMEIGGANEDIACSFGSNLFISGAADASHIDFKRGALFNLSGMTILKRPDRSYRHPVVHLRSGSRGSLLGVVASALSRDGTLIECEQGAAGHLGNVSAPGWKLAIPRGSLTSN